MNNQSHAHEMPQQKQRLCNDAMNNTRNGGTTVTVGTMLSWQLTRQDLEVQVLRAKPWACIRPRGQPARQHATAVLCIPRPRGLQVPARTPNQTLYLGLRVS